MKRKSHLQAPHPPAEYSREDRQRVENEYGKLDRTLPDLADSIEALHELFCHCIAKPTRESVPQWDCDILNNGSERLRVKYAPHLPSTGEIWLQQSHQTSKETMRVLHSVVFCRPAIERHVDPYHDINFYDAVKNCLRFFLRYEQVRVKKPIRDIPDVVTSGDYVAAAHDIRPQATIGKVEGGQWDYAGTYARPGTMELVRWLRGAGTAGSVIAGEQHVEPPAKPTDLQLNILTELADQDSTIRATTMSRKLSLKYHQVKPEMSKMEKHGLVKRPQGPRSGYQITPKGRRFVRDG